MKLTVNDQAKAKFFRPRTVPYLLRDKVEAELDRLQEQGVISPVKSSPWAAPIVPVLKKKGKIRICGDYKITVNQATPPETYPLPTAEQLFANLSGGKHFSKLDLSSAYLQLPLASRIQQSTPTKAYSITIAYPLASLQHLLCFNATWIHCYKG